MFKNITDDTLVIKDLIRKDLGVPVRFGPGEVLDLEALCGEHLRSSRELLYYLREGSIEILSKEVPFNSYIRELLEQPKRGLDMKRVRQAAEPPVLGFSVQVSFEAGRVIHRLIHECGRPLVARSAKEYFCPSCNADIPATQLIRAVESMASRLQGLRRRLILGR